MKIAHESMNCIFPMMQAMTDYDYCLVHLMDENPTYQYLFEDAAKKGREIILDNSIFELGEAYDENRYYYWVQALRPTYTIIPDILNDCDGTMARLNDWFKKFPDTLDFTKAIAVVQGQNQEEAIRCFHKLQDDPRVAKIGISFDSASHLKSELSPEEKMLAHMAGRIDFVNTVTKFGWNRSIKKPLHLLGCSLPQELKYYSSFDDGVIDSVDTSCPVVHGFMGIKIESVGLARKHPQKLFTLIDETVTPEQAALIGYNTHMVRSFANA